jgi:hypothetical protein
VECDEDLPDTVVLRSDLQIRLDSGDTISGPYLAYFKTWVPLHVPGRAPPAPDADLDGRAACFYSAT